MAAAQRGGRGPDLYRVLGVSPQASQDQITQAWRRRARDEHPDTRPGDADAAGRFGAIADAYRVLSDPGRRAAYDRAHGRAGHPVVQVTVRQANTGGVTPPVGAPGPPLRAGPVSVEGPSQASQPGRQDEEEIAAARLLALVLRYLDTEGRLW
jgi:curved DNA-binding protein CbpA